jgi:hypothetical protein
MAQTPQKFALVPIEQTRPSETNVTLRFLKVIFFFIKTLPCHIFFVKRGSNPGASGSADRALRVRRARVDAA